MLINAALLIFGFALLYIGGEVFIKGSNSVAQLFKIKPLIIAATVAAFATSAPELFVSLTAAIKGSENLAMGNIIGSCIANIALVLGICSLIRPIKIEHSLLRRELPILAVVSLLIFVMCLDLYISRLEAIFLLFGFCMFIYYCIKNAKQVEPGPESKTISNSKVKTFLLLSIATFLLVFGAHLLVRSAIVLARYIGMSQLVIGLTIVAIGTSLPELSVSAVASLKGKHDISIGNVIGSNIFNMLLIIGCLCLIRPVSISLATMRFELPLMVVYSVLLLPLFRSGFKLSRREGLILLLSYIAYIWVLFNRS